MTSEWVDEGASDRNSLGPTQSSCVGAPCGCPTSFWGVPEVPVSPEATR